MNRTLLCLLFASVTTTSLACRPDVQPDGINRYQITASLDPAARFLDASTEISFSALSSGTDAAVLYLHRQLTVDEVRGPLVSSFWFDPATPAPAPWLPVAGTLHITFTRPLVEGEELALHIHYSGSITEWPAWSANVITEEWIEIGLYLPWFPYNFDEYGPFSFDVRLSLDSGYEVRGYGSTERTGEGWHIERTHPTSDIVVVASRDLRTKRIESNGHSVQLHHPNLDYAVTTSVTESAMLVLNDFSNWFGEPDDPEVTLIASKRELGGGYARPGLIVLTSLNDLATPERRPDFLRYIGHEIGHQWWTGAPTTIWEDWLNESFAEYSALLLLRAEVSEGEFQSRLAQKRSNVGGTTPIWGIGRSDVSTEQKRDEVERVLYDKGPVLLNELAERIGTENFLRWCRTLLSLNIRTTEAALALLGEQAGTETSEWFEELLRQR